MDICFCHAGYSPRERRYTDRTGDSTYSLVKGRSLQILLVAMIVDAQGTPRTAWPTSLALRCQQTISNSRVLYSSAIPVEQQQQQQQQQQQSSLYRLTFL